MKKLILIGIATIFLAGIGTSHAADNEFNEEELFPLGIPASELIGAKKDDKFLLDYLPHIRDIILKFVAPIVAVMFIYSGIRLIYAGDDEEDIKKSKMFLVYLFLGTIFIAISYSLIQIIYYILK